MEIINEKVYQNIKKIMNKESDFFTEKESQILMQFLMQRQKNFQINTNS